MSHLLGSGLNLSTLPTSLFSPASMDSTMSAEASVFATRYVSAVGLTVLLFDHTLTFGEEINLIWLNPAAGLGYRTIFIFNRYVTEAISIYAAYMISGGSVGLTDQVVSTSCRIFLWVLALTTTVFTTLSNLRDKWLLMCTFGAALALSMVFSVFSAQEVQPFVAYIPFIHMCVITEKPWALPVVLGVWVVFDFFLIILALYNAFERPRRTQADVMVTLQHDGAKIVSLVLRLGNLIVAIVAEADYCFVTLRELELLWAMCSVVTSRLQIRVERLRFTRFGGDLLPPNFLHL
ncbi:hypothetical protein B0H13DRAFT_2105247 [Mycena leptocephala]|nr:hypothetical protein B0H13DRAFT_2105247 [Mycena leptocephala]